MAWKVEFTNPAKKQIRKMDRPVARAILGAIDRLLDELDNQEPIANVKQLEGEFKGSQRLRVGDYRIIFEQDGDRLIVTILKVGHRREVYRG